jgi:hypothetical protein
MKFKFSRQIFEECSDIKFNLKTVHLEAEVFHAHRRTDWWIERLDQLIVTFWNFAKASAKKTDEE